MTPTTPNISDVVILRCSVGGISNPMVTWTKNGSPFLNSNASIRVSFCSNNSLITINFATIDDNGVYECIVTSDGTTVSQSISIEMDGKYTPLILLNLLYLSSSLRQRHVHLRDRTS